MILQRYVCFISLVISNHNFSLVIIYVIYSLHLTNEINKLRITFFWKIKNGVAVEEILKSLETLNHKIVRIGSYF